MCAEGIAGGGPPGVNALNKCAIARQLQALATSSKKSIQVKSQRLRT